MADGSVLIDTEIDQSGFKQGMKSLSSMASGAIGGLTTILAGAATALSAMGAAAIKLGSDFEAQMSRVLAISGATEMEFEALVDLAKQLGADTAFSASEAAAGMENLASAGFTASQIIAAMPGLLDLAAVSGGDVAAASEVAASALNAFGLAASEAGHVANVFAKAAADTNAEALDMGEAMKYVAPAAKAMGISLEETAAAIGLMSNAGIKGSQAGTSLRGALSRIAKPTEVMTDCMTSLGISFYNAEGNMISLEDQVAVLQGAFAGLTQEERNQALVTLYGQEALSGMLALIEAGPEELAALTKSLEESDGAAASMAATINDNLKGDIDGLMGSLETLGIAFYESMTNPLREGVQLADGYVNQLAEVFANEGLSGLAGKLGSIFADIVTNVAEAAPAMIDAASSLLTSFADGLIENAPAILEAGLNIGVSLLEALLSLGSDILRVGAEYIYLLLTGIVENLPSIAQGAMDAVSGFVSSIETYLPIVLEEGRALLMSLVTGISENLPNLVSQGLDALMRFATVIYDNAPTIVEAGFDMLSSLVQGILNSLPALIAKGPEIISKFANVINDNFPTILAKGVELIWQIITGIIKAIPDLVANIPKIFSAIVDVWSAFNWLSLGKNAITWMKDGILKMIGAVKSAGKSIAETVVNAIINLPQTLSTLGKNAISFFGSGISGMRTTILNAAKGIFNAVLNTIKSLPSQLIGIGKNLVEGLWNGITNKTDWIISKIKSFGGAVLKGIKDFFGIKSPSTVMRDIIGANLAFGVAEGVSRNAEAAVGAMEDMAEDISDVEFDAPRIPVDDIDYDAIVAKVGGTVQVQRSTTSEKVTAGPTNSIYRSGNDTVDIPEKPSRGGSNPEYIENNIYVDGKKVARIITPYIAARMAWEGK